MMMMTDPVDRPCHECVSIRIPFNLFLYFFSASFYRILFELMITVLKPGREKQKKKLEDDEEVNKKKMQKIL